ncbi:MAG: glycosyltransferase [Candidatus Margulisiibacteriota bacterium]
MPPHVSCIIVNFNGWDITQRCISSLESSSFKNFNIILIDNNSNDAPDSIKFNNKHYHLFDNQFTNDSFEKPTQINEQFYSIRASLNGGFPFGINIGLSIAQTHLHSDYIWILNNDTICNPNTLIALIKDSTNNTIVGSTLIDEQHNKLRSMGSIHPVLGTSHHCKKITPMTYIPFTSVLLSKDILNKVGPLNEDYFLYYDDADYCISASKQDIKLKQSKNSIIIHQESYTSSKPDNNNQCPDWIPIYSRKLFMKKFNYHPIFIFISLALSFLKRFTSIEFKKAKDILQLIIYEKTLLNQHHYYRHDK